MSYAVKEIYYTLQGEGMQTGRAAVFCRFSGCNLWSGREAGRVSAICTFCDTDFVGVDGPGGGRFAEATTLADAVSDAWGGDGNHAVRRLVVLTGGEPLLQLDAPLIDALHARNFEIALETNGTLIVPPGVDHICVSPKANAPLAQRSGDELKLVYPQTEPEAHPDRFTDLDFKRFYLQPLDDPNRVENARAAVEYCLRHPQWRLSVQTHKALNIP